MTQFWILLVFTILVWGALIGSACFQMWLAERELPIWKRDSLKMLEELKSTLKKERENGYSRRPS